MGTHKRAEGERLIDYYRQFGNPELGQEEAALTAFDEILGQPGWAPNNPYAGGYDRPIELGLLALHLQGAGAGKMLARCAAQIADRGYAHAPQRAELHAAAMLRALGHEARLLTPRRGQRTPDIGVDHACGGVDVEVVHGDRKAAERDRQIAMTELADVIPFRPDADTVVYLMGELSAQMPQELLAKGMLLEPGQYAEDIGNWRIVATRPAGRSGAAKDSAARDGLCPADWAGPTLFNYKVLPTEDSAQRVEVLSLIPAADYLNPVKRKAERSQRTNSEKPYLIAFDVEEILNANALLPGLKLALSTWDHVSGVLIYYAFFSPVGPEWRQLLVRNPAASTPLPPTFLPTVGEAFGKRGAEVRDVRLQ